MEIIQNFKPLTEFEFEEGVRKVLFVETVQVADGVECDVYCVEGDNSKDLGVIKIKGKKTPLQEVLKGERTVEGFIKGNGKLTVTDTEGNDKVYPVDDKSSQGFKIDVGIGEIMQWEAVEGSDLIAFEICVPPPMKMEGIRIYNLIKF